MPEVLIIGSEGLSRVSKSTQLVLLESKLEERGIPYLKKYKAKKDLIKKSWNSY